MILLIWLWHNPFIWLCSLWYSFVMIINLMIMNLMIMNHLIMNLWLWTYVMEIWYEPLTSEPLIWTLMIWLCFDPSVWYPSQIFVPSHEGNMTVSLMHQWHDSSVYEWCCTPSPLWYDYELTICIWFGHYDMFRGAYGCIIDMVCFDGFDLILLIWFIWWMMSCAIRVFTFRELATPLVTEVSPPTIYGIPRSPLRIKWVLMIWYDMICFWARGRWLNLYPLFLFYVFK